MSMQDADPQVSIGAFDDRQANEAQTGNTLLEFYKWKEEYDKEIGTDPIEFAKVVVTQSIEI
jgi:hypothetical protein